MTTQSLWLISVRLPEPQASVTDSAAASAAAAVPGPTSGPGGLAEQSGRGLGIAYVYLNRRERTVAEVRARLEKAEIDPSEVDSVIAELLESRYLDDARYALVFAEDKRTLEQWGQDRISRALRERGVDRDLIAAALAQAAAAGEPEHNEHAQALSVLERRFPVGPTQPKDRDRAFGVLVRKGYNSELAADAVRSWAGR